MSKQTPADNEPGPIPGFDLQDIFDNAPIGIFTTTPDGRITSANLFLARMFGYDSPKELIESTTDDVPAKSQRQLCGQPPALPLAGQLKGASRSS